MFINSLSSAMLMDASVQKEKGYLFDFIQLINFGRTSVFSLFLLPIKLSSTKNTPPFHPMLTNSSNSDKICSEVFVRTFRPNNAVISQNSQSNGHPLEYCTAIFAYFLNFRSDKSGRGVKTIFANSFD